jgi:DegV family protein with EDD domain
MANVAIITDTSADLTPEQAEAQDIRQVPLSVSFGDESFAAGTELTNQAFYERLTAPDAPLPKTAAPSPAQFAKTFRRALEGGADEVVCFTLSKELSATWSSAVSAKSDFEGGAVRVIDTMTTSLGQSLLVREAADQAAQGATGAQIAERAEDLVARSHIYFVVDTLEYLQRGGRIGKASALVGSLLAIKPILTVVDGEVEAVDRRRTTSKARKRLIEICAEKPVERLQVLHTMTADIEGFADRMAEAVGLDRAQVEVGITGPVAGTHVGPGVVGAALILAAE